ncbi:hypothetical protein [Flavobacterium aquicola]|uniref:Uncharacterized protein n=1 Tax=Flavobacterium aquicola TaxID=1682742 RepID=A0A3E0EQI0_9FLAO|nr:hypothetical protein [Flavobacterium aquicola]REH00399.1 hypothetical protein C8P67_103384 [Flavobacterium aquicola]
MEPNKIEKEFKEQLNSRKIKPSEMAWDKLEALLDATDEKPKRNFRWLYAAAGVLGFLLVSTVYFNRFESVKVNKDLPIVLEQKTDVNHLEELNVISKSVLHEKIQKKLTKKQTVVASNNAPKKQLNELKNKEELPVINNLNEDSAMVNSSEDKNYQPTAKNKYISAEQLLAEVSNTKFEAKVTNETIETRKAISVNPNDLLLNAETELNQSYRESALDRFNKKLNAVKTVLVNRNYEK